MVRLDGDKIIRRWLLDDVVLKSNSFYWRQQWLTHSDSDMPLDKKKLSQILKNCQVIILVKH